MSLTTNTEVCHSRQPPGAQQANAMFRPTEHHPAPVQASLTQMPTVRHPKQNRKLFSTSPMVSSLQKLNGTLHEQHMPDPGKNPPRGSDPPPTRRNPDLKTHVGFLPRRKMQPKRFQPSLGKRSGKRPGNTLGKHSRSATKGASRYPGVCPGKRTGKVNGKVNGKRPGKRPGKSCVRKPTRFRTIPHERPLVRKLHATPAPRNPQSLHRIFHNEFHTYFQMAPNRDSNQQHPMAKYLRKQKHRTCLSHAKRPGVLCRARMPRLCQPGSGATCWFLLACQTS